MYEMIIILTALLIGCETSPGLSIKASIIQDMQKRPEKLLSLLKQNNFSLNSEFLYAYYSTIKLLIKVREENGQNCLYKQTAKLDSQNLRIFFSKKQGFRKMDASGRVQHFVEEGVGENVTRGGKVSLVMNLNYQFYCILSRLAQSKGSHCSRSVECLKCG